MIILKRLKFHAKYARKKGKGNAKKKMNLTHHNYNPFCHQYTKALNPTNLVDFGPFKIWWPVC